MAEQNLHEDSASYGGENKCVFAHERLQAYQASLELVGWLQGLPGGPELSSRLLRQIDKASTSAVLNLAEGNGRPLEADRRPFLETGHRSSKWQLMWTFATGWGNWS